ncbi:hypothetical protein [Rhizobium sp. Leaf453]|uniref:hypothetical protein n=1 Tax=Rhizobium sp. Leaf453 TaxID=1736380 RepID=UPI000712530A|nr:hypothetical protein [Rhizobium sp. Leaf453]KQU08035.1 hypothetical protein ASG68_23550 [Rhizobium sp. Leaf453]
MDLADIASVLDPKLTSEIVETIHDEAGNQYALVLQSGEYESALSLVGLVDGEPMLLTGDVWDVAGTDNDLQQLLAKFAQFDLPSVEEYDDPAVMAAGPTISQEALNILVHETAIWGVDNPEMNSRELSPPETRGGKLGCAWAVNRIVKRACGQPVGGGLQTAFMILSLRQQDREVPVGEIPGPGVIVISPTSGGQIGHVGILGENDKIYSNSTKFGMWKQSHTVDAWVAYYGKEKGLPVFYFELNPRRYSKPALM